MVVVPGTRRLLLDVAEGVQLEADLHMPHVESVDAAGPPVALLILHPYPRLGGSMHDPIVSELYRAGAASPRITCVLRYNQRGVGRSSGSRSLLRAAEDKADALALCEYLAAQLPKGAGPGVLLVAGYSWGSCLAVHALSHPSVAAYAGVSFPLGGISFLLGTRQLMGQLLQGSHVPRLLVLGDRDQFTRVEAMRGRVAEGGGSILPDDDSLTPAASSSQGGGGSGGGAAAGGSGGGGGGGPGGAWGQAAALRLKLYPGEDHFWSSQCASMAVFVVDWLLAHAGADAAPPRDPSS